MPSQILVWSCDTWIYLLKYEFASTNTILLELWEPKWFHKATYTPTEKLSFRHIQGTFNIWGAGSCWYSIYTGMYATKLFCVETSYTARESETPVSQTVVTVRHSYIHEASTTRYNNRARSDSLQPVQHLNVRVYKFTCFGVIYLLKWAPFSVQCNFGSRRPEVLYIVGSAASAQWLHAWWVPKYRMRRVVSVSRYFLQCIQTIID